MPKRDGQGEAESYTESGEEEAKGGENVQKISREDVVQAALTVERWCKARFGVVSCACPFWVENTNDCVLNRNRAKCYGMPHKWGLEEYLRTRGLNNAD